MSGNEAEEKAVTLLGANLEVQEFKPEPYHGRFFLVVLRPGWERTVDVLSVATYDEAIDAAMYGVETGSFAPVFVETDSGFIVSSAREILAGIDARKQKAPAVSDEGSKSSDDATP